MPKRRYLTTTLPYVNAEPHLGFALELVQADALARLWCLGGDEVFFNTGTDEHGLKIYRKAEEEGREPQAYVDSYAARFGELKTALNLSYKHFIRTTDAKHVAAAQEIWRRCAAAGDIYKKNYQVKYCVGCELEKTESELIDGCCAIHPNLELEIIEEENYFFKFSNYQERLLALYNSQPDFVVPATRLHEIKTFVEHGLQDFSISRLAAKMPWGVPVPDDATHVMYVWFDALTSYISTLGWPSDEQNFDAWWARGAPVQLAGKDNLRQQAAMWQAMLMSAGLPPTRQIFIHGFITSGGQKMSKSLGNVINPFDLVKEYGTDAVRYFLLRHVHPFEDSDVTLEKFKEAHNAHLANGLGNLTSRVLTMAVNNLIKWPTIPDNTIPEDFKALLEHYEFQHAADLVWQRIGALDQKIQETQPFKLVKDNPEEGRKIIAELVVELYTIARMLNPLLPATNARIKDLINSRQVPDTPLFPRKE